MSVLIAALAERARRANLESRMRAAIKNRFEFLEHRRWESTAGVDRVRRMEVYAAAAEAVSVHALTNSFCRVVATICTGQGAVPIATENVRSFAFMRRRVASSDVQAETKRWYAKAAASGFDDIERPRGAVKRESRMLARNARETGDHVAAAMKMAHFDKARDIYWKLARDLQIMELYAMEGKSVREIAEALDMGRSTVQNRLTQLRLDEGGHLGRGEDSDDGEDSSGSDRDGPGGDR